MTKVIYVNPSTGSKFGYSLLDWGEKVGNLKWRAEQAIIRCESILEYLSECELTTPEDFRTAVDKKKDALSLLNFRTQNSKR